MLANPFAVKVYRDIAKAYSDEGKTAEHEAFLDLTKEIFDEYRSTNHSDAGTKTDKDTGELER